MYFKLKVKTSLSGLNLTTPEIATKDLFSQVCKYQLVNRSEDWPRVLPSGLVRVDGELDRMRFRDLGGVADAALLKKN